MGRTKTIFLLVAGSLLLGAASMAADGEAMMNSDDLRGVLGPLPGWQRVAAAEGDALAARLAALGPWKLDAATDFQMTGLPFYKDFALYQASSRATWPLMAIRFLRHGDQVFVLDGSPVPLREVNRREGLQLTAETVIPYLGFFFDSVRGSGDGFRLVGRMDDVPFHADADDEARRQVADRLVPLTLVGTTPNGFALDGTMLFQTGLYSARFVVSAEGEVTTMGEKLLVEKVPASVRVPLW